MKRYVVVASALLTACSALSAAGYRVQGHDQAQEHTGPAAEPARPATGQELFQSSGCSHCHRIDGAGGQKGPDLSGIGRRWTTDQIRMRIRQGALEMPAYQDVLGPAQIETLAGYLHQRRARETKAPAARGPSAGPA